jgi:hypothetical protein
VSDREEDHRILTVPHAPASGEPDRAASLLGSCNLHCAATQRSSRLQPKLNTIGCPPGCVAVVLNLNKPGIAKSKLHWPAPPHAVASRSTEPASKPQLPSPTSADLAPPPTEPSPPDQTTLSYWKRNGDGSLIETGTSVHVLQTDPPSIPRVITFDGTPLAMPAPSPSANASFGARWSAWQDFSR